jgi:hypothetical protein
MYYPRIILIFVVYTTTIIECIVALLTVCGFTLIATFTESAIAIIYAICVSRKHGFTYITPMSRVVGATLTPRFVAINYIAVV